MACDLEDIPATDFLNLSQGSYSIGNNHWVAVCKQILRGNSNVKGPTGCMFAPETVMVCVIRSSCTIKLEYAAVEPM